MTSKITGHCLVRNEDQFVWYAISSVLPYLAKIFVYDTGSTDKTVEIIKKIQSSKIIFKEVGQVNSSELVKLRQEQIEKTQTEFFMIVDGDEIWPKANLQNFLDSVVTMPVQKIAAYCRTRNAVGDLFHYLPDNTGNYQFAGQRGHFNMRAFRHVPELTVEGIYPLETYKYQGRSLNNWEEKLLFVDTWYLHVTHLERSTSAQKVAGFRLRKVDKGIAFEPGEIPEVLQNKSFPKRSIAYEIAASLRRLLDGFVER